MTEQELIRMNLPKRFWSAKWELMEEENKELVRRYVQVAFPERKGNGLLLWGLEGRGKTYIASVIAKILRAKDYFVFFLPAEEITYHNMKKGFDDTTSINDRMKMVDVLIIDDLQFNSDKGILYSILKYRTENFLSTIITMRANPQMFPIVSHADGDFADFTAFFNKYFQELMPVIKGSILPIQIDGVNFKQEQQKELENLMMADSSEN